VSTSSLKASRLLSLGRQRPLMVPETVRDMYVAPYRVAKKLRCQRCEGRGGGVANERVRKPQQYRTRHPQPPTHRTFARAQKPRSQLQTQPHSHENSSELMIVYAQPKSKCCPLCSRRQASGREGGWLHWLQPALRHTSIETLPELTQTDSLNRSRHQAICVTK
jgi:hypothetical protein